MYIEEITNLKNIENKKIVTTDLGPKMMPDIQ